MNNFPNRFGALSTSIFTSILASIVIASFPSTCTMLEQPKFNSQLQFRRVSNLGSRIRSTIRYII